MIKFPLGATVITSNALATLAPLNVDTALLLARHLSGDWGDMTTSDKKQNDDAITNGGRIFSSYRIKDGLDVWIITEADRSVTTILLPEDY
jgi:hypothetical protein